MNRNQIINTIQRLVVTFNDNIEQYLQPNYKEAQLRKEFIDKFFTLLGWDVDNNEGVD